eukprot:380882_1
MDTLTLYCLNGFYLSSYYTSFHTFSKRTYNISLISMLMATVILLISIEIYNNTFCNIVIYASDNNNIRRCGLPIDNASGHATFTTKYSIQCFLDLLYIINMRRKRNVIHHITKRFFYSCSLLFIAHLISAIFISVMQISYPFTIVCHSICILCFFPIYCGDNNHNNNHNNNINNNNINPITTHL